MPTNVLVEGGCMLLAFLVMVIGVPVVIDSLIYIYFFKSIEHDKIRTKSSEHSGK